MKNKFFVIDAFTSAPFEGNPAGVVVSAEPIDATLMQNIATEIGLSETAFVHPIVHGLISLRWFTPVVEAPLCGHATLAAAHAIWGTGMARMDEALVFDSRAGRLQAVRQDKWIELDFPSEACAPMRESLQMINEMFGDTIRFVGQNRFDYIVELATPADVRN